MAEEVFDKSDRKLDELVEVMTAREQRLAGQEQDARQPRLAMEADGPSDTKTRERIEGAAKVVQAMHGDGFSANRVDPDPMCSISFGMKAERPALPCRDVVLIDNDAAVPKLCLTPLLGKALTNSRSWLTPRRHGLYSDENHHQLPL